MKLPNGQTQSLNAKLQAALASINSGRNTPAKNQLNAFINEVNAQTGKKITSAQAAQLIVAANDIIKALH
jgi:CHASE3 domain sensor protein